MQASALPRAPDLLDPQILLVSPPSVCPSQAKATCGLQAPRDLALPLPLTTSPRPPNTAHPRPFLLLLAFRAQPQAPHLAVLHIILWRGVFCFVVQT